MQLSCKNGCHPNIRYYKRDLLLAMFVLTLASCRKLVEAPPPVTTINTANVYTSDASAAAVLTSIYAKLSQFASYGNPGLTGASVFCGLSADELALYKGNTNPKYTAYYVNSLSATTYGSEYWTFIYPYIFTCNAALAGLSSSNSLTPVLKQELMGEAKFMRAYFYFYLVNLYGDVPLVTNTDYKSNANMSRTSQPKVYQQIIADLKDAQALLSSGYVDGGALNSTTERVRPNKWAATALLARSYLYTGDWVNAEAQASTVINNSSLYSLVDLNSVFLKNSSEAIWQLQPVNNLSNTEDAKFFVIPATGPSSKNPVFLSDTLYRSFDSADNRKTKWVKSVTVKGITYYFPFKYKVSASTSTVTEYLMMLRLGEQYLVRAEARAQQGNVAGGSVDLNSIRTRAGLGPVSGLGQAALIAAIARERRVELFTEMGQRWFDLKRTGSIDPVMAVITPQKANNFNPGQQWNPIQSLYPLPVGDLSKDLNLKQNAGY